MGGREVASVSRTRRMRSHWQLTSGCGEGKFWVAAREELLAVAQAYACLQSPGAHSCKSNSQLSQYVVTVLLLSCPLLSAVQRPACALHYAIDRLL